MLMSEEGVVVLATDESLGKLGPSPSQGRGSTSEASACERRKGIQDDDPVFKAVVLFHNTTNTNRCLCRGSPRASSVGDLGSLSKDCRGLDQIRQLSGLIYGVTRVRL